MGIGEDWELGRGDDWGLRRGRIGDCVGGNDRGLGRGKDWRLGRIGFREGGLASSVTLIRVTKGRGLQWMLSVRHVLV